jgi:NDP-sugar pyrophosphorylase family protein
LLRLCGFIMINLITLAGEGSRFSSEGIKIPKPLVEVNGVPMIIRSTNCLPRADKYVFVCREEHIDQYHMDKLLGSEYPNCEIITLSHTTEGQACTAEIGIINSSITNDDSILISCCDYGLEWCPKKYNQIKSKSNVVVWSTTQNEAFSKNPSSYSWLEVNGDKLVKTHVKQHYFEDSYNNRAIVGTFYFKRAGDFLDSLQTIYDLNIRSNGEYYIDNIFNTTKDLQVSVFDVDEYHCWGTPEDMKNYENKILG